MKTEKITDNIRCFINEFLERHWYSTTMVIRGKEIDLKEAEGFFIAENNAVIGLVTYMINGKVMEITSLDSLRENQGIGTMLIEKAAAEAKKSGCEKITLVTTNDNINAIRFYQKRGFDMVKILRGAAENARKIKPEIPLIGENNIPIRHEIEFEMIIY